MIQIKINKIKVILDDYGPDYIYLEPEVEATHPIMGYQPSMKMEVQAGYGVEWVKKQFNREPDQIIDCRRKERNGSV